MPPANRLQTTKKFEPNKANVVGVVLPKYADLKQSTRAPSVKPEPCAGLIVVLSGGSLWARWWPSGEARNDCPKDSVQ
jgi:hypothetical protein